MHFLLSLCWVATASAAGPLHEAVANDDVDAIKKALSEGADINKRGDGGQTPLMFAVLSGKTRSVKLLLEKGADTTIGEQDGYTPMHGAGFQGRAEIAKALIDHGLDPSDRHSVDGFTPLHRACWGAQQRHTETVRVFLEAGVSPDEMGLNGATPIEMTKRVETAELLHDWQEKLKRSAGKREL